MPEPGQDIREHSINTSKNVLAGLLAETFLFILSLTYLFHNRFFHYPASLV
jgi:hypothetical protein